MTPSPALAPVSAFAQMVNVEDYDAPLPSFVGLGLGAYASGAELGDLADRAEAGVSALQLIFAAQDVGAVDLPNGLAEQLRHLLDRATGRVIEAEAAGAGRLALIS
jgi:hypothetical protein